MNSTRQILAAGITFLLCGVAFSAVALFTQQTAFYGVAPAFLTLGLVFIATSKSKQR